MSRKRLRSGLILGTRSGEWWIGARRNFPCDAIEINVFGLTLIIPNEIWARRRRRR